MKKSHQKSVQLAAFVIASASMLGFQARAAEFSLPIVGGETVSSDDAISRTTVALYFVQSGDTKGGALCTGSILDDSHILTAAHCVEGAAKGVVIFRTSIDFSSQTPFAKEDLRPMTQIRKSSDYPGSENANGGREFNDLAIVTFTGGLAAGYRATKIISSDDFEKSIKKGARTFIAGYGTTGTEGNGSGTLRKNEIKIDGIMPRGIDVVVGTPGEVACHGDSGGPAYVRIDGETYLWGVASRSDCESFSIYTKYDNHTTVGAMFN